MRKQEIKYAVDLISHYYSSAMWYEHEKDIDKNTDKAYSERCRAEAIELFLLNSKNPAVIHKDSSNREYAVSARLDDDKIYIRWISTACHPWDEISFDMFKEEVEELKNLFRVFSTDGTDNGMNEL